MSRATRDEERATPTAAPGPGRGFAREIGRLLVLALPLALIQAGQFLMGAVDAAMLGRHSEAAMAGAGIGNGVFFSIGVFGLGVLLALDTLVPQALGAGDPARAGAFFRSGLRAAFLLALPLSLLMIAIGLALPHGGLRDPAVAAEARTFVLWRVAGLLPFLVVTAQRSFLQAHGKTRALIAYVAIGNVVNFAADYVLIFGDPGLTRIGLPAIGLPALGTAGAAIATTSVTLLGAILLGLAVRRVERGGDAGAPVAGDLRRILRLGVPVGLHLVAETGVFALALYVAGVLPGHAAAGHQIAITLASVSFSLALGVGGAAAVRVGHAVGAGDRLAARRAGGAAFIVGMALMGGAALVFAAAPTALARLYTTDAALIAAAVPLIQIAAVFQLSDSLQAVGAGALRGAGDNRTTFVANLLGHYAVGLPVALVLAFSFDLGAPGLWWGLTIGLTVVAGFLVLRFYRVTSRPIAVSTGTPPG